MQHDAKDIDKVLRLIGLARRANALHFGADACEKALRSGASKLLFVAADAGASTRSRFQQLQERSSAKLCAEIPAERLAAALGRVNVAVISVESVHFATEMQRLLGLDRETEAEKDDQ